MNKFIDLKDKQFGEWIALEYKGKGKWLCRCSCGIEKGVSGANLRQGLTTNCGHLRKKVDLKDKQINEWKVLDYIGDNYWKCECSCGKIEDVRQYELKSGIKKSCGHKSYKGEPLKIGMQINDWNILEIIDNEYVKCKCSCGEVSDVIIKNLINDRSKSCGHHKNKFKDIKGEQFGEWTVIDYISNGVWLCQCSCGEIRGIKGENLRSGHSKSCGHNTTAFKDISGQQFGEWTVLEYLGNSKYLCECSCGKIRSVNGNSLRNNKSKYCNGTAHRLIDLKDQRFGKLTVIEHIGNSIWASKCDCGNLVNILGVNLRNGSTQSCGCSRVIISKESLAELITKLTADNGDKPLFDDIAKILNVADYTVREYVNKYELNYLINNKFRSRFEKELYDIVKTYTDSNVVANDRITIPGIELDLYIPDKKIAIEFNGNYWHSNLFKSKKYHQEKTMACRNKGIRLIHIFEHEYNNNKEIILNILKNSLTEKKDKIYGRNTEVKKIEKEEAVDFLNKYHLQGYVNARYNYGCLYNNELIGVMSIGKPRFKDEADYEIIRFAWRNDIIVIGGIEKFIKQIDRDLNPDSLVTYSDISKFTGKAYERVGFEYVETTQPSYVWVNYKNEVLSRYQTQKHKLVKQGLGTDEETEDDIMSKQGYYKVYNSGNIKLIRRK